MSKNAMSDCTCETAYKLIDSHQEFASCMVTLSSEGHSVASNAITSTILGEVDGRDVDTLL